jgi:hypothetical protein
LTQIAKIHANLHFGKCKNNSTGHHNSGNHPQFFTAKCAKNAKKSLKLRALCKLRDLIFRVLPRLTDFKKALLILQHFVEYNQSAQFLRYKSA